MKLFNIEIKYLLLILFFILSIYFTCRVTPSVLKEGFKNKSKCPNILIQQGNEIYLYNSRLAKIPGVNPVKFESLEDYVEFLEWQKSQNIQCPVLFLQHSYDTQGKPVYKIRPSPLDPQGGLPPTLPLGEQPAKKSLLLDAGRNDPPYNEDSYPAYDPMNMYEGEYTPLDKMFHMKEKQAKSDNPMDVNWGGVNYSNQVVDSGYYLENT
tara:strand:+ start:8 stop:634 length:627 start_codon:yes stop_codon:yes gene_type:complete